MAYYRLQGDIFVDDATGNVYEDRGPVLGMVAVGASGAWFVAQRAGTGLQSYIYSFTTGTTREEIHFPVGASISEITVICSLNAGSATNNHAKGMLAIDAETDVDAGNILTGTTWPDSTSAQQRFYPIPLDTPMTIPLSAVMVNGDNSTGRLDMRSSVAVDLDWWILAN